jgi:hypothetical protein
MHEQRLLPASAPQANGAPQPAQQVLAASPQARPIPQPARCCAESMPDPKPETTLI